MGLAAGISAVVGLAGWFAPQTIGGGHPLAEEVLAGNVVLGAIPLWLVARYFTAIVRAPLTGIVRILELTAATARCCRCW